MYIQSVGLIKFEPYSLLWSWSPLTAHAVFPWHLTSCLGSNSIAGILVRLGLNVIHLLYALFYLWQRSDSDNITAQQPDGRWPLTVNQNLCVIIQRKGNSIMQFVIGNSKKSWIHTHDIIGQSIWLWYHLPNWFCGKSEFCQILYQPQTLIDLANEAVL